MDWLWLIIMIFFIHSNGASHSFEQVNVLHSESCVVVIDRHILFVNYKCPFGNKVRPRL